MAKPVVSEAQQNQQNWNDFARVKRFAESGFQTQIGITPNGAAVLVPECRPLVLVNTASTVAYLARSTSANTDAAAPSSITTSHIAVPPNSVVIWNSGQGDHAGNLVSIRTSAATLAVYVAEEDLS